MLIQHTILAILIAAIWGVNFVAIHFALKDLSPIFLCCLRFILVSLPAIFFIKPPKTSAWLIVSYGLLMFAVQFSLMFLGMHLGITAGLASILLQTQAFFTILFSVLFFKEKLSAWQIGGALLSFTGIGLVAIHLDGALTLAGFLCVMAAALCWGAGTILVKKMGQPNSYSLVAWASLVAWPPLLVLSLLWEGPNQILENLSSLSWTGLGGTLFIAYGSTCFGFISWNYLVGIYPLSVISPFTLLVPVFGLAGAALMLGESVHSWKVYATLLILSGIGMHIFDSFLREKQRNVKKIF